MKPRLLDLFCGAGGAAMGYSRAGFDVVGVDIRPQPNYPFEFVQADALELLGQWCGDLRVAEVSEQVTSAHSLNDGIGDLLGGVAVAARDLHVEVDKDSAGHGGLLFDGLPNSPKPALDVKGFDAIHASPPCQDYSKAMRHLAKPQPRLIEPVRELLEAAGLPWVIENVPGAPLPAQDTLDGRYGVELCGTMFGLPVWRHRLFETSFPVYAPRGCDHRQPSMNPHNQIGRDRIYADGGKRNPDPVWNAAMGVPWMDKNEGREAIPPAYTELVGHQLLQHVRQVAA